MKTDRSSILRFVLNGTLWSFTGVLLTIVFFYWSERRNPFSFSISLDDVQNLVEVRERIPDLRILYRNQDILELKRNIRIARITLRNDGATLLQQHYDALEPFGLRFPAATILDFDLVDSNSDYLKEHLLVRQNQATPQHQKAEGQTESQGSLIPLQKVIFEEGKYATLRVYLLQDQEKEDLVLEPVGKLANIDRIRVSRPEPDNDGPRLPVLVVAFVAAYVGIIAAMFSVVGVITWIEESSKKRKIAAFVAGYGDLSPVQSEIIAVYRDRWDSTLSRLLRSCARGEQVLDLREDFREQIDHLKRRMPLSPFPAWILMPSSFRRLLRPHSFPKEIFSCSGTEITLSPDNREFVLRFFASVGILEDKHVDDD